MVCGVDGLTHERSVGAFCGTVVHKYLGMKRQGCKINFITWKVNRERKHSHKVLTIYAHIITAPLDRA